MKIEICKKYCPRLKNKKWKLRTFNDTHGFIPVIVEDSIFHEWICRMKITSKMIPEFKEISVYEDCPYYLEHELNTIENDKQ